VLAFLFPLQKAQSAWPCGESPVPTRLAGGGDLKGAAAEPNGYGLRSPVKPSDAPIFIFIQIN
jgi:hypothetical protein